MTSPSLTIRNLTSVPFELKVLERFESAQSPKNGGAISNITRTLSFGLLASISTKSSPTASQLSLKAEIFAAHDVSIPILPFETKATDILTIPNETLRLTFEVEGQRYRIDTPTQSQKSTILTPLSPDPLHEFTGVYLTDSSHLAIYSSANLESWMSNLKSELPLSALSIPGTHNSPTHHTALPSVRCQAVSVKEQLNNGVRFLDIRVQPESSDDVSKDGLILVHSAFSVSLAGRKYFRDMINHIFDFLTANPTECIIMSVKREGVGWSTDQHLSKILHTHYATDANRWFTENRIPTLGEARSKIVLLRRFKIDESLRGEDGMGWAMDGESWPDNCADGLCSSGEIRVQDFYEVAEHTNIEKKIGFARGHLDRAAKVVCKVPGGKGEEEEEAEAAAKAVKYPFFINFLSASNFWRANCWPDRIAAKVNPSIVDFLCRTHGEVTDREEQEKKVGDGSTGIVVCDWVGINGDWDLVRCIVGMNSKLELRGSESPR